MPLTKRLFVLRHVKSSWDDPVLDDHERPLAPRGRRALGVLAAYMRQSRIEPDLVLCSSARRTRETLEGVAPSGERLIEAELYTAGSEQILERLRQLPDDVAAVMLVGHNPAAQMLVLRLSGADSDRNSPQRVAVQRKFPTGGLATLTFEGAWSELVPGGARLVEFTNPRELTRPSAGAGVAP
jgi:phosphohistidine phosphatase